MNPLIIASFLLLHVSTNSITETHIQTLVQIASSTVPCKVNENTSLIAEEVLNNAQSFLDNDIEPLLPFKISCAESRYINQNNHIYDGEDGHYTATGIFQITRSTFEEQCEGDRKVPKVNISCGIKIILKGQLFRWKESESSWKNPPASS